MGSTETVGIPNGDCAESVWRMHGDCSVIVTRAREHWRLFPGLGEGRRCVRQCQYCFFMPSFHGREHVPGYRGGNLKSKYWLTPQMVAAARGAIHLPKKGCPRCLHEFSRSRSQQQQWAASRPSLQGVTRPLLPHSSMLLGVSV